MKLNRLLPATFFMLGGIVLAVPDGVRDDRSVDLSVGWHTPGSYRHGSSRARIASGLTGSPSIPGTTVNGGYPFKIGSHDWQPWTNIGNNVEITNMERGKIAYKFTGGGGGGNRGDMVFFWIRATMPSPVRYVGYLQQIHTWYEYDENGYQNTAGSEFKFNLTGGYVLDRSIAEATLQAASFPPIPADWVDEGNEDVEQLYGICTYSASNTWILVHIARSHGGAGDPNSPPPSNNATYFGEFTYDTATLGGGELVTEMFNFQRTRGDENKVQISDTKSHGAVPAGLPHGGPPLLEITGPSGKFPLNP